MGPSIRESLWPRREPRQRERDGSAGQLDSDGAVVYGRELFARFTDFEEEKQRETQGIDRSPSSSSTNIPSRLSSFVYGPPTYHVRVAPRAIVWCLSRDQTGFHEVRFSAWPCAQNWEAQNVTLIDLAEQALPPCSTKTVWLHGTVLCTARPVSRPVLTMAG